MGVQYDELRRVCQQPVADGNDVAGLLFGDKLSLPLTKLLIDRGWSPSLATVGMLVTGVIGSLMQFGGRWMAFAGALLLLLYYILDCVDGEVARWRKVEHARWGYYEYIFHFIVKPTCFVSLAFATWSEFGTTALLVAGVLAAVATLWLKLFLGLPSIVFVGSVFGRGFSGERPYSEYIPPAREQANAEQNGSAKSDEAKGDEAKGDEAKGDASVDQPAASAPEQPASTGQPGSSEASPKPAVFKLRPDLVTLRSLATNFDIGLMLLVMATLVDALIDPFSLPVLGLISLRGLWLLYYGLLLPLDFVDYVATYFRQGHFDRQMVRLLAGAHGFVIRSEEQGAAGEADEPAEGAERSAPPGDPPGDAARTREGASS